MNVLEPSQRKVGQNFATQPAGADDQDFALVSKKIFDLRKVSRRLALPARGCHTSSPARNDGSVRGPGWSKIWSM